MSGLVDKLNIGCSIEAVSSFGTTSAMSRTKKSRCGCLLGSKAIRFTIGNFLCFRNQKILGFENHPQVRNIKGIFCVSGTPDSAQKILGFRNLNSGFSEPKFWVFGTVWITFPQIANGLRAIFRLVTYSVGNEVNTRAAPLGLANMASADGGYSGPYKRPAGARGLNRSSSPKGRCTRA